MSPDAPLDPAARGGSALHRIANGAAVNHAKSPILGVVFDRLVRQFAGSLRTLTGSGAELTLEPARSVRFDQYLEDMPRPCLIAVAKAPNLNGPIMLTLDAQLILAIVDILLGGRRCNQEAFDNRPFSSIERRLAEKLMGVVLEDLADAFAPLIPVSFELERLETEPQFAIIARGSNPCLQVGFDVELEGRRGVVEVLIPHATLEPVRNKLTQLFFDENPTHDPDWRQHISRELGYTQVRLQVTLAERRLPVETVLAWGPGTLIPLDLAPGDDALITCDDVPMFRGSVGQAEGRRAVEITETINAEEAKCDVLSAR